MHGLCNLHTIRIYKGRYFDSAMVRIPHTCSVLLSDSRLSSSTNPVFPYCFTVTSSGLTPQYGSSTAGFPRIHSFVPLAAFYSSASSPSLSATSATILPNTSPAKTSSTTTSYSPTPAPTRKPSLSTAAKAGIGSGVGLVALAVVALLAFCFWRRRNRADVSATDGGAAPAMAQTNNTAKDYQSAPQPVQQQPYLPQPQGYQGAALPVQQQYQPQPHGYQNATQQLANTKFPDSADIPPYSPPAPIYTSGIQNISAAPNEPTSDTKIASSYPVPPAAPPLSPNNSHQMHQQQQNPAPPWEYLPNSPISTLGSERSGLHHQDIPPTHSELGASKAGVQHHHTGTPWNHSELGASVENQSLPWNHSELPGIEEPRAHYLDPPTNNNNNRSELGP